LATGFDIVVTFQMLVAKFLSPSTIKFTDFSLRMALPVPNEGLTVASPSLPTNSEFLGAENVGERSEVVGPDTLFCGCQQRWGNSIPRNLLP